MRSDAELAAIAAEQVAHWCALGVSASDCLATLGYRWSGGVGWAAVFSVLMRAQRAMQMGLMKEAA